MCHASKRSSAWPAGHSGWCREIPAFLLLLLDARGPEDTSELLRAGVGKQEAALGAAWERKGVLAPGTRCGWEPRTLTPKRAGGISEDTAYTENGLVAWWLPPQGQ